MGYKLCTAEKPSVARDIARVVGAKERRNGYFIGNGYIVTWAIGHLVGLAEPEAYGYVSKDDMWNREQSENRDKAYNELPIIPDKFMTVVLENTKEQFEVMKSLMHRDDVDCIIDCGDMGAEGHILQWLIRDKAGCTKTVKRFCATSMTDEAIIKSMNNLRDADEFSGIIQGELCKKKADWILGMSMSRCASIKYNARVDVGRVQSPTLFFVVRRFMEVSGFKPTEYYRLQAELKEGFSVFLRLEDKSRAELIAGQLRSAHIGRIIKYDVERKLTDRPQLYDITELQRDGNRIFGYGASEVLEAAQCLYETHKVLSYPRTDSKYITSDLAPYMPIRIKQISGISQYTAEAEKLLERGLRLDKKIVDDSKVTDHHALIVTEKIEGFDLSSLHQREQNILHLVLTRLIVSFSQRCEFEATELEADFGDGVVLSAKGRRIISQGWKEIQDSLLRQEKERPEDVEEQSLPRLEVGASVAIKDVKLLHAKTTPPKLHTEATLLTAMENAGSGLANGSFIKGKGIGTQATRGAIIKSLFDKNYIANKKHGKTNYLVPTKQGIATIKVLPKDLYSPQLTADWEEKIAGIAGGILSEQEFMSGFNTFIMEKIKQIKASEISDADFSREHEEFAKCPWCGESVYVGSVTNTSGKKVDSYYCSSKCGFSMRRDNIVFVSRTRKEMTVAQMRQLLKNKSISAQCLSKNEMAYRGKFILAKTQKGYVALEFEFDRDVRKGKK